MKKVVQVLFAISAYSSFAQSPAINFYKVTTNNGLSQATVNVLYKDNEGFLWIGTDDGLNRFDGKDIVKYHSDLANKYSITSNDIYGITETSNGKIFVCHYNAGISCLSKSTNRFTSIKSVNNKRGTLSTDRVYGIKTLSDGYVWARTINGISRIHPESYVAENFDDDIFYDDKITYNIDIEEAGNFIWFGSNKNGLQRITKQGKAAHAPDWDCSKYGFSVSGIAPDKQNNLWVVSEKGIFIVRLSHDRFSVEPYYTNATLFASENKILLNETTGKIWIGTSDKGLLIIDRNDKKNITHITSSNVTDNLSSNVIHYLLEDKENTIFVGSGRGVNIFSPYTTAFNNYQNVLQRLPGFAHPVYAIYELKDGNLLLGNRKGVYHFNISSLRVIPVTVNEGIGERIIYRITALHDKIFVSTSKGILEIKKQDGKFILKYATQYPELRKVSRYNITDIHKVNDSTAYFSSYTNGFYKWNFKKHEIKAFINRSSKTLSNKEPVDNRIMNIVAAMDGQLIICTENGASLFNPANETFLHFKPGTNGSKELVGTNIKDAYDDGRNIWFTTYGQGLQVYDKKAKAFTRYTIKDGLPNNSLYAIIPAADNRLWIPTNNGVFVFNTSSRKTEAIYTNNEGLPDNEFNAFASIKGNNGIMYFSTLNGIVSVNPHLLRTNTFSPGILLTTLKASNHNNDSSFNTFNTDIFTIPAGYNAVHIKFASNSFAAPLKTKYRLWLEGFSNNWIELENTNEIRFAKLPHGSYTLKVVATNSTGKWNGNVLSKKIIVEPMWFQTHVFYATIIVIFVAAIFGLYYMRINQLKKEQAIRSKLAADLHDDLGSTLTSINVYTHLAFNEKEPVYLEKVKESSRQAMTDLKDMIWVMNDKKNSIDDLLQRINNFTIPLCNANNIKFINEVESEARDYILWPEEKRNLYLIIKEAINNSIKYAHANALSLAIYLVKGKPAVIIKDNGKGFGNNKTTEGNGLQNMINRARGIKYNINIQAEQGVCIELVKM